MGFLFFRGSLRTRTSFEVAVQQLGGRGVHLSAGSDFWEVEARDGVVMDGTAPEHVRDAAAVLSSYCDALAIRPKPAGKAWEVDRRDEGIRAWASNSQVPVINMESTLWHPLSRWPICSPPRDLRPGPARREAGHLLDALPHAVRGRDRSLAAPRELRAGMDVRLAHPRG